MEPLEPRLLCSADPLSLSDGIPTDIPALAPAEFRQLQPLPSVGAIIPGQRAVQQSEVAFIDASAPDAAALARLLSDGAAARGTTLHIVSISGHDDGVATITEALGRIDRVSAVHVLSHGGAGFLQLGRTTLDLQTLHARAGEVAQWGEALALGANVLLYGCNVAESASGQAFVERLARLTGASVAASTDLTGHTELGGDWVLEHQVGRIDASVIVDAAAVAEWRGVFAQTFYLQGDLTPAFSGLSATPPVAGALPNFDPGRDAAAGLVIAKGGTSPTESDPVKHHTWVAPQGAVTIANESVVLTFWTDTKDGMNLAQTIDEARNKAGQVTAFLMDLADPADTSGVVLAVGTVTAANWGDGFAWEQKSIDFGVVNASVAANRYLALKLIVDDAGATDDLWFAYDTAAFQSRLDIGVANAAPTVSLVNTVIALAESAYVAPLRVADVVVTDDGIGTNVLTLAGADAAMFELSGGSLYLRGGTLLDHETLASLDVSVLVDDSSVGAAPDAAAALAISVTNVNESPTASGMSAAESYVEDTVHDLADIVVSDPDGDALTVTLTLSDATADTLSVATVGSTSSVFAAGVWQATGPAAELNVLLAGVAFIPAADRHGGFTVQARVSDGVMPDLLGTKTFAGLAVNDAPSGAVLALGSTLVGSTLTADATTLFDADGLGALAFAWERSTDGGTIWLTVAGTQFYTSTAADVGALLRARASYVDGDGTAEVMWSTPTGPVTFANRAPVIVSNGGGDDASVSLFEGTTSVTAVTATDADLDAVTYAIAGGADSAAFVVSASSGALTFIAPPTVATPLDADGDNVYEVWVGVSDGVALDLQRLSIRILPATSVPAATPVSPPTIAAPPAVGLPIAEGSAAALVAGSAPLLETSVSQVAIGDTANKPGPAPAPILGRDATDADRGTLAAGGRALPAPGAPIASSAAASEAVTAASVAAAPPPPDNASAATATASASSSDQAAGSRTGTLANAPARAQAASAASDVSSAAYRQALDQARGPDRSERQARMAGSAALASAGLSVGYVVWLLRGGVLLSSLLTSLPAWRALDPIAVLSRPAQRRSEDADDDESLAQIVTDRSDAAAVSAARAEPVLNENSDSKAAR
jgi:hypothetical protein